jgi:ABC-2 type transport system ATP-binding protein
MISKRFYLGSYLTGMIVGVLALLVGVGLLVSGVRATGGVFVIVGGGLVLYAKAVALALVWRMWRAIQQGKPRTTPLKAVLLLLLPIFNFYWAFRVFRGFALDFNAYAREQAGGRAISVSTRLPTALCILMLIPPAWPVAVVLMAGFMAAVCDALSVVSQGAVSLGRQGLPKTLIEVARVTKRYGRVLAVDNLSFSVERGEVVGLLGPNAAGKTTTMRILTCYLPATAGTARIAGHDVFDDSLEARRYVGYMPEGVTFYPEMRVLEYLKYRARLKEVPAWARPSVVAYSMQRCGVTEVAWQLIGSLSKGYRQRVGLADALLNNPPILILDEPTIGLDPNQIIQTRGMIKELGQDHTVLLSTHILPEVETLCQRVLIIHKGRLVFSGLPGGSEDGRDGHSILLEVRGPADRIQVALSGLEGVARVRAEGGGLFTVVQKPGTDIREAVFRTMARNEWPILEMRPRRTSLEETFVRLTAADVLAEEGR